MKKIFCTVICLGLALALVACTSPVAEEADLPIEAYAAAEHQQDHREFHLDLPMPPMPGGFAEQPTTTPVPSEEIMQAVLAQIDAAAPVQQSMYVLMRDVAQTFSGGRFYLRGRTTVPANEFNAAVNNAPIVMAANGNRSVMEQTMDWGQLANNAVQATALRGTFGDSMRMVITPAGTYTVFPERNRFFSIADFIGGDMYTGEFDFTGLGHLNVTPNIAYTHVTRAGRVYLATTLPIDDGTTTFFFHNNQLRRMETTTTDGAFSLIELDTLHRNPPESMFNTAGMQRMPLADAMVLFEISGMMFALPA